MKTSHILGINARNLLYSYPYNPRRGKKISSSKLLTKRAMIAAGIQVPSLIAVFRKARDILSFDFLKLPNSFVLKPSKGLGGEGIIVVKKKISEGVWLTTQKTKVSVEDLKLQIMDILEGAFSIHNMPDVAFIEEFVGRHKVFRKYAYRGTPDIRVIVFNKVPVAAMLRLPTPESGGRANLHQGAIAVGIDLATGITTKAWWKGNYIKNKPGTQRKLNGIKIPSWTSVLEIAVRAGEAVGLQYFGADVVLHPEKGPMILELNYQPGLSIQLANACALRKRLERVEGLEVRDAEHGVRIAKALFMSSFADRVKAKEGIKIISSVQEINLKGMDGVRKRVLAKIDTGAWRTSISEHLAKELGLLQTKNIVWKKRFKSALGVEERPVIGLTFWMAGRKIKTFASSAKRVSLKYPVIIGRKDLKGFLVDPVVTPGKVERVV